MVELVVKWPDELMALLTVASVLFSPVTLPCTLSLLSALSFLQLPVYCSICRYSISLTFNSHLLPYKLAMPFSPLHPLSSRPQSSASLRTVAERNEGRKWGRTQQGGGGDSEDNYKREEVVRKGSRGVESGDVKRKKMSNVLWLLTDNNRHGNYTCTAQFYCLSIFHIT